MKPKEHGLPLLAKILVTVSDKSMLQGIKKLILSFCLTLLGSFAFCQMNPKYVAFVGGKESGTVLRGAFLAQEGVAAMRKLTSYHWEDIPVDSFTLYIQRDTAIIYQFHNKGNHFEEELKSHLKGLQAKDRVLIFNIYARDVGDKVVFLQPLEYIIE